MIYEIRRKIVKSIEGLHIFLFGNKPSPTMYRFIKNISWTTFGFSFSAIVFFIMNILAARILGPKNYGIYNYILAFASVFSIFAVFGMGISSIKFISQSKKENEKNKYISNSVLIVFSLSILGFIIGNIFSFEISNFLAIENNIFGWIITYSLFFSFRRILENIVRAKHWFYFQAVVKILEAVLVFIIFISLFLLLSSNSYLYYLLSVILGLVFVSIIYLIKLRKNIFYWEPSYLKKMFSYAKIALGMNLVLVLPLQSVKIFIGNNLDQYDLGLFSAYIVATVLLTGQLAVILNNVFFPMLGAVENKIALVKKANRIFKISIFPLFIFLCIVSTIMLNLMGKEYKFSFVYIAIFSLIASLQLLNNFYRSIIQSITRAYRKLLFFSLANVILLICLLIILPKVFNLTNFNIFLGIYSLYIIINTAILFFLSNNKKSFAYEK